MSEFQKCPKCGGLINSGMKKCPSCDAIANTDENKILSAYHRREEIRKVLKKLAQYLVMIIVGCFLFYPIAKCDSDRKIAKKYRQDAIRNEIESRPAFVSPGQSTLNKCNSVIMSLQNMSNGIVNIYEFPEKKSVHVDVDTAIMGLSYKEKLNLALCLHYSYSAKSGTFTDVFMGNINTGKNFAVYNKNGFTLM